MIKFKQYHWAFQVNIIGPAIHVFVMDGGQIVEGEGFTDPDSAIKYVRQIIDARIEKVLEELDEPEGVGEFDL